MAEIWIKILKSKRKLQLFEGDKLLKEFQISLGFNPVGHKEREGDGKTPEGEYYVCVKGGKRRKYFLGLSYPGIKDAEAGLKKGLIKREDFERIKKSIEKGECPPWDTPLGGAIGIHEGLESDWAKGLDWTEGCIGLHLNDAIFVFEKVRIGTKVLILP